MKDMPSTFPPQFLKIARETPCGSERAWQHPVVLDVVAVLATEGNVILGGDVMHDEAGNLSYYSWFDGAYLYCGSWHIDFKPDEQSWAEYVAESAAVTVRYIEAYVQRNGGSFWYVLVFADEERYVALEAHKM